MIVCLSCEIGASSFLEVFGSAVWFMCQIHATEVWMFCIYLNGDRIKLVSGI